MLTLVERKRELEKELSGLTSFQIINANIVFDTLNHLLLKVCWFYFLRCV